MSTVKNILFIMTDQLRWDYLSCYGHPHLHTPHIDRLAEKGVRFDKAYVQSPVCGPSRASAYTGRTVFSHGSTWNHVPLPIGEWTLGDYLKPAGMRTAVVGKTHMIADDEGMARLGLNRSTDIGMLISQAGFDPYERDDGLHPTEILQRSGRAVTYNDWLRERGYDSENPWNDYANSAEGSNGELLSGWYLENSNLPARIREEHSETAYMTDRAMQFIESQGDNPWLCHLSYIKPHWPYIAPAPYHDMYNEDSWLPVHRDAREQASANPVYQAFTQMRVSQTFADSAVREKVLPGYMGLVKQIDDHLGRLFEWMERSGHDKNTMIVFTSDHGDYLGDHWMGEKELFHECSVRVPLIIVDPRREADATRGTVCDALVEAIDMVPTFVEAAGLTPAYHRIEGQSLQALLFGEDLDDAQWRDAVFSEIDYACYQSQEILGSDIDKSRGYMLRTRRWKYVHFTGFPPQLFDLDKDPDEFDDLGQHPEYTSTRQELHHRLLERLTARKNRVTATNDDMRGFKHPDLRGGVLIGFKDDAQFKEHKKNMVTQR